MSKKSVFILNDISGYFHLMKSGSKMRQKDILLAHFLREQHYMDFVRRKDILLAHFLREQRYMDFVRRKDILLAHFLR